MKIRIIVGVCCNNNAKNIYFFDLLEVLKYENFGRVEKMGNPTIYCFLVL